MCQRNNDKNKGQGSDKIIIDELVGIPSKQEDADKGRMKSESASQQVPVTEDNTL